MLKKIEIILISTISVDFLIKKQNYTLEYIFIK